MKVTNNKRLRWGIICFLVGLTVAAVATSALSRPKLYQGKTVRQWVSLLDMHVDYQKQREEAAWALVQIGPNALPDLERILAWRPNVWETVRGYAVRFGLVKPRPIHPLELQSRACEAAYTLAERADVDISRLVPQLHYHFTNGTYADSNSGRALANAGSKGISVLTNLLLTGSRSVRDNAAALRYVKTKPEVIAALIMSAHSDPDPTLRANAVLYLGGSRGPAEQLVPLGLEFLRSENGYARWAGASLLANHRSTPEAKTALEAAISDPDERGRSVVKGALEGSKETR